MTLRYSPKTLVITAAMLAVSASIAFAQDTTKTPPRSQRRIPISKDSPGEVVAPRVDTVTQTVYRTDTLRLTTTDTLRVTNTVTRVDTVTVQPMMKPVRLPGGLYFGLGGGVSAPNGAIYTPNSAGPTAQAQLGWQGAKNLLGLRGDVNWTKPGEDSRFANQQADPDIINFSADARLNLPFLTHTFGATHRFGIYGIGGYTHTMFKNLPMRVDDPSGQNVAVFAPGTGSWTHENGFNAGGGASLGWGRTEIFIESRVLAFSPNNAPQSRQVPFVFGVNWY
jgi:hypothetical protein